MTDPQSTGTATAAKTTKPKTEVATITMDDGRVVDFVGKRKLVKESLFPADGTTPQIRLDFRNGETRLFTIPTGLLAKFAAHGAEQKLGDEIAGLDDIEDCVLAVDELIDRLATGEWSQRKEGSGLGGTSVLLRAMAEVYSTKTVEQLKAFLKGKSNAEKLALRESDKLKPVIARIEAEKAQKGPKINTEELLAGLEQ